MQVDRGVITINRSNGFTLSQAREVLPIVRRITQEFSAQVEVLIARLEAMNPDEIDSINEVEEQVNGLIKAWHSKIKKLGAKPKGLWLVDFDFGQGFYCWKFPEKELLYWHTYEESFANRRLIVEETEDFNDGNSVSLSQEIRNDIAD